MILSNFSEMIEDAIEPKIIVFRSLESYEDVLSFSMDMEGINKVDKWDKIVKRMV